MITGLFVFNQKGEVLISKLFREGIKRNVSEVFRIQVIASTENSSNIKSPILTLGSTTFMYIRHKSLWFVAVTRSNVDASLVLEFLYKLVDSLKELILEDSIGGYLTESSIKNNFCLIYEILDLTVDFGYIQNLSAVDLRNAVISPIHTSKKAEDPTPIPSGTAAGLKSRASVLKKRTTVGSSKLLSMIGANGSGSKLNNSAKSSANNSRGGGPGGLPWRKTGIYYKKQEIYLDVIEEVNLLISSDGNKLKSLVEGTIKINSKLSGMPVCSLKLVKIGAGDDDPEDEIDNYNSLSGHSRFLVKNCNFHQCVNLQETDQIDNTISFIPPDGVCELAKFRIDNPPDIPFVILHDIDDSDPSTIIYDIELTSKFPRTTKGEDVVLKIPIPLVDSKDVRAQSDAGGGKIKVLNNEIQWSFKKFPGRSKARMSAVVKIGASKLAESFQKTSSPLSLSFSIEGYSSSGWSLAYLHVDETEQQRDGSHAMKWVKYTTKSKGYDFRM
ncbi:unnamed protein product [Ambrosiozyma monospora]|uniref:Unnamed protein product n=2 Tax=Ambrosiozyma monospora TaxID=43982 RepID=A0ACB5T140_AMBMO|nr:unnamed protein product [Ambrosiozyma monospora]